MNSMPSSGYTHKSTYYNKQYRPWKGVGLNRFPVGTAPGHIRPLTNNDAGNNFPTGFGLARPIKHYRKGRVIPPNQDSTLDNTYNINRFVKSSKGTSLGGGFGGSGLLNEMQDKPGGYIVQLNTTDPVQNCNTCEGIGIVASYKPNVGNLTQDPAPNTSNPVLCCNQEKFAKQRVIYASTNLKKNYYSSNKQYLQNRCKTYQQKAFNFLSYPTNNAGPYDNNNPYYYSTYDETVKPGSPLALANMYLANCQPNAQLYEGSENAMIEKMLSMMQAQSILTEEQVASFQETGINSIQGFFDWLSGLGNASALTLFKEFINNPYTGMPLTGPSNPSACQLTVYKPNNYQFATQGAVSSSARMLKLNVNTISTNAASIQNYNNMGAQLVTANQLYAGDSNTYTNLLKNKAASCNTPWPLNMSQSRQYQNKKFCHFQAAMPSYQMPASQPSTYRYFPGTVFSSNHYSQSPNTYTTSAGSGSFRG